MTAHDANSLELKPGDTVTLKAVVTHISGVDQVSLNPVTPIGDKAAFNVSSKAVTKATDADV